MGSGPCAPASIDPDWAPVLEFSSAEIFQHSPFGDILNSLRSFSLSGDPWWSYVWLKWEVDDEELRSPPTTHFISTVEDLSDTLDYGFEDINGIDDDAGEE